jgi:hypothetical protein
MTDLANKFATFESQVSTQHTELMEALNSIAFALGAPPTTPTTTLADLSTQLNALIDGIALIYSANTTYHASTLALLGQINTNTDLMLTNNSLNAQRLLTAILATACACPSDVPFIGPPLDVTPTDLVDEDKCRRIQYYLSIFSALIDGIANYGGTGAMVTSAVLTEILYAAVVGGALVGGEVGAVGGPPGIVVGAIVGIIGALIGALGSSYIFQMSAQWHQSPLPEQLLAALYAADSADAGANAFYAVINASDVLNNPYKPLINALFWNGWANDMYSATPVVDDSAFDGSICLPDSPCQTLTSTPTTFGNDGTGEAIIWPSPIEASDHTPANYYTQFAMWATTNLVGWSFTPAVDVLLVQNWNTGGITVSAGTTYTLANTDHCIIYNFPSTTQFSIELCPPA